MATIVLSAAGAALGGSIGGTALGLSMVAVGRFAGATLGRMVDQRLMGSGSDVVETGRIDRFRLTGSGEGEPVGQVYGRMRVGGQVIWATQFEEHLARSGGGKGGPPQPTTHEYSYSISIAIALCEGEIGGVGRIWADGNEIAPKDLNMRVYKGTDNQLPDPKMEAVEGADAVPAYRGTAYVVMEDLDLSQFGNRVPQFTFEVTRPDQALTLDTPDPVHLVQGVAMLPGSGEYALATTPVTYAFGPGQAGSANINTPSGKSDFETSLDALGDELPLCGAASLIVSWFGDDLRCGDCTIRPKVEQGDHDGNPMPWRVAGLTRDTAMLVPRIDDAPIYGGTPSDQSVIEAITKMQDEGKAVMFYPFILMDQIPGNTLPDPWSDAETQSPLPWRGRITGSEAPGRDGSPDGTAAATAQVAQFFGTASASDFAIGAGTVSYSGPAEWSYRRFILHQAALCAAAGGVDSFCIGSEMRALTQLRDNAGFPAVAQLQALAAEVRSLLPAAKLGYAADWSEYFGYQPQDGTGDRYFHLDPLWADANTDFIGIDNYMPLSDWRDGDDHADAHHGAIYDLDYLQGNIEGGEGYDWYYHSVDAEAAQIRTPITDDEHNEPWVWRYKDIRGWWQNPHHERIGGVRQAAPTAWEPASKPVWFTELGCAAIDKGTNQPNKFLDPKSSESQLPRHSDGRRDELIQMQYLRAMLGYWGEAGNNPVSPVYDAPMLDMSRAFVWAWDARPYPYFPGNETLWSDAANYARGHWITGRMSARSLASVVSEICLRAGLVHFDTRALYGFVRGYVVPDVTEARAALQPLMLRYGFDAVEREGLLTFVMRDGRVDYDVTADMFATHSEIEGTIEQTRLSEAEMAGRIRLRFIETDANFEVVSEETVLPDEATHAVASSELPIAMTRAEGRQVVERWLAETRVARDALRFSLPPSQLRVGAGDVVRLAEGEARGLFRIDRVEQSGAQLLEAVRIEPETYRPIEVEEEASSLTPFAAPVPVLPLFMDLPLLTGDEVPHAPHLALSAKPWPGSVALYDSVSDSDFALNKLFAARSTIGVTQTTLAASRPGMIDRGTGLQVKLLSGQLASLDRQSLLAGGNIAAIGDGTPDNWELFQFETADLIDTDTYLLSNRLRGQLGTDAVMPDVWPEGSYVVILNAAISQIELASSARNVSHHYRVGPAKRGYDDPSYVALQHAFAGNGLRPYSPVHLRSYHDTDGAWLFEWVRRTRLDGDSWEAAEVPLAEETETYLLRVVQGAEVLREVVLETSGYVYDAAEQASDGITGAFRIEVAQVSARYGAGPFKGIDIAA